MIIAINETPGRMRHLARGVIGRYMWRVGRDVWIWSDVSLRHHLIPVLTKLQIERKLIIISWKNSKQAVGYESISIGEGSEGSRDENGWINLEKKGK